MKNISYFRIGFTVFVGTLLFISCEKDKSERVETIEFVAQTKKVEGISDLHLSLHPEVSVNGLLLNGIIAGDTIAMINNIYTIDLYPPTLNSNKIYTIDVNNDGQNDYRFELSIGYSQGLGQVEKSHLYAEHQDAQICGTVKTDSIYMHIDTITYSPTVFKYNRIYTCYRMAAIDSLDTTIPDAFYPQIFAGGNTILYANQFYSDTLEFNRSSYSSIGVTSMVNGQLITYYTQRKFDCHSFPLGSTQFLGIKIKNTSGQDKFGWIALQAISKFRINLIASAVQL